MGFGKIGRLYNQIHSSISSFAEGLTSDQVIYVYEMLLVKRALFLLSAMTQLQRLVIKLHPFSAFYMCLPGLNIYLFVCLRIAVGFYEAT